MIEEYSPLLLRLDDWMPGPQPAPGKWSNRQVLGHLVDSAQNNIRRFVVAQYEELPHIVYKQDDWVRIAGYHDYDTRDLVQLWILLNRHMVSILKNIPPGVEKRGCKTDVPHTIEYLAADYIRHCRHHLHQLLNLEPLPYP